MSTKSTKQVMPVPQPPPLGGWLADFSRNALEMIEANPAAFDPKTFNRILTAHADLDAAVANAVGWIFVLKAADESQRADEVTRQITAVLDHCAQTIGAVVEQLFAGGAS